MQVPTAQSVIVATKQEENRNPSWFQPGQSGNPNGRPKKGWTWSDIFTTIAERYKGTSLGAKQVKMIIGEKLFDKAMEGDIWAIKEIIDRMEGQAKQKHEVTLNPKPLDEIPERVIEGRIV